MTNFDCNCQQEGPSHIPLLVEPLSGKSFECGLEVDRGNASETGGLEILEDGIALAPDLAVNHRLLSVRTVLNQSLTAQR